MDYCTKWQILGIAIWYMPPFTGFLCAFFIARWVKRKRFALPLALVGLILPIVIGQPMVLVLWNGIRPAICNTISLLPTPQSPSGLHQFADSDRMSVI